MKKLQQIGAKLVVDRWVKGKTQAQIKRKLREIVAAMRGK